MIKDILFYPAAVLVIGGLIVLALSPAFGALPSGPVSVGDGQYRTVSVSGLQLNRLVPGGDAQVQLDDKEDASTLAITVAPDTLSDDPLLGPHFPLAADLEVQFSGYELDITVRAKSGPGPATAAQQFRVNYANGRGAESSWQVFDLTPEFQDYTFTYNVPIRSGDPALDYLGIRPVATTRPGSMLIERVEFNRRKRWTE